MLVHEIPTKPGVVLLELASGTLVLWQTAVSPHPVEQVVVASAPGWAGQLSAADLDDVRRFRL